MAQYRNTTWRTHTSICQPVGMWLTQFPFLAKLWIIGLKTVVNSKELIKIIYGVLQTICSSRPPSLMEIILYFYNDYVEIPEYAHFYTVKTGIGPEMAQ